MNNDHVVITTINRPTNAVRMFATKFYSGKTIVIGDRKTPQDWKLDGTVYINCEDQERMFPNLSDRISWNHYSRKMLGYAIAIENGATSIIDTDDDNIPYDFFHFPSNTDIFGTLSSDNRWVNPYSYFFSSWRTWPRGYPLENVRDSQYIIDPPPKDAKLDSLKVGVWQGLADLDPDMDAIYRLTDGREIKFEKKEPVVLPIGTWAPFNSQNTKFSAQLFPLLYLPTTVTFRFTDILRSYVAQPILWANGYCVGFSGATVYQERNIHNYLEDFKQEIPFYGSANQISLIIESAVKKGYSIQHQIHDVYSALLREGFVKEAELYTLDAWLELFK